MKKFSKEVVSAYQTAHKFAYQMKAWKGVSIYPKIVDQKEASELSDKEKEHLTRKGFRWYVYFRYRNPDTGKFEKHIAPTYHANRFSDFRERQSAFRRIKDSVIQLLEDGRSPYDLNVVEGEVLTIERALDYALEIKKNKVAKSTYDSYSLRAGQFKDYLKKRGMSGRDTHSFRYQVVREFLNSVAKNSSVANRNNTLRALKALFSEMYKNDLIKENYVAKIDIEDVKNQRYLSYTQEEAERLISKLEKEDPVLALFVKFVGYNFLRPVEVVRLKVKDINLKEKTLSVFVKQGTVKTKRIPDDIVSDLSKYDLSKKDNFLFGLSGIGKKWDRSEAGRREHYSRKYSDFKNKLGFGEGYVLYSTRHTYATIGYKNLRKRMSKDEALDTLMEYTGHATREAVKKYIHYIDAEIVGEYKGVIR